MENIWRESKKGLPLHPQSREIATQDMMRGEVEVGDIQAKLPDLEEVLKKNFRKKLEVKNKLSIFAPRFRKTEALKKEKFFERFTYSTSSTSIKEDEPSINTRHLKRNSWSEDIKTNQQRRV